VVEAVSLSETPPGTGFFFSEPWKDPAVASRYGLKIKKTALLALR